MGRENRLLTLAAITTLALPLLVACQMQIIEAKSGSSCQNQARNADFGFRTDLSAPFMDLAAENSKIVRISYDNINRTQFLPILKDAQDHCLEPLIVFNPRHYDQTSKETVTQELTTIVEYAKNNNLTNFAVELGNEPDDKGFWTGDFASFAAFVKDTESIVEDGGGKIVLAALVDPAKYAAPYLDALQAQGVDLSNLIFGVHAYNVIPALVNNTNAMYNTLRAHGVQNPQIWMTELGAEKGYKQNIVSLLDTAKQLMNDGKIKRVYIHELPDTEGWGFVSYPDGTPNSFYPLISSRLKQK